MSVLAHSLLAGALALGTTAVTVTAGPAAASCPSTIPDCTPAVPTQTPAPPSGLIITPATGDTDNPDVAFGTLTACPDGSTDFMVRLTGPGIPTDPAVNALGLNAIPNPGSKIDLYAMGNTWANVLSTQGVTLPYAGTATLTLLCIGAGEMKGEFATTVTFTPSTGTKSTYQAEPPPPTPPTPVPHAVPFLLRVPEPPGCDGSTSPCGTLTLTVPINGDFLFSTPEFALVNRTPVRSAQATMPDVTVMDSRPGFKAWQLSGKFGNFTTAGGEKTLIANYAGWTPVLTQAGGGAVAGATISPGFPASGQGLAVARILGSAPEGHNGVFDAVSTAALGGQINMRFPINTPAGDYRSTMTLTLVG
jgi:hypothetical protein